MLPFTDVACAVLLSLNALAPVDTISSLPLPTIEASRVAPHFQLAQDTVPKRRAKAVTYSDGYGQRLTWHRRLSYGMLPLFVASYFSGDQILSKGEDAPGWAKNLHRPAATGSAVLFTANAITGGINSWQSRKDPNGRTRRILHGLMFTVASGGFVYAGTKLADDAEQSQDKRIQHRNVALGSMGLSTASWLLMLIGN